MKANSTLICGLFLVFSSLVGCGNSGGDKQTPSEKQQPQSEAGGDEGASEGMKVTDEKGKPQIEQPLTSIFPRTWRHADSEWLVTKNGNNLTATVISSSVALERYYSEWLKLDCAQIEKSVQQALKSVNENCGLNPAKVPLACNVAASGLHGVVKAAKYVQRPSYPYDQVTWDRDVWAVSDDQFDKAVIIQNLSKEFDAKISDISLDESSLTQFDRMSALPAVIFTNSQRQKDYEQLQFLIDNFAVFGETFKIAEVTVDDQDLVTHNRLLSCDLLSGKISLAAQGEVKIAGASKTYDTKFEYRSEKGGVQ